MSTDPRGKDLIPWLGPKHCTNCKDKASTSISGANHPICADHRTRLFSHFEERPEYQIEWAGNWSDREYWFTFLVKPSADDTGTPDDKDPDGRLFKRLTSVHDLHSTGAISRDGMKRLIDLRSANLGLGRREVPADDWSPTTDAL